MLKYILFLLLFFMQYSFAQQDDAQNRYYKSGKLYEKRFVNDDSLFLIIKYYENGMMKEQLTSKSSSFGDSNLISKYKYYSNGLIEQEETRTDSLEYIVYSKKNYNGKGKLRESYKRIDYNYNKIGDEQPLLPPAVTKKYYSNGQLESLIHGITSSPPLEKQYYRNGQLKYYNSREEDVIKEFYLDNSLKKVVKNRNKPNHFENEFYENGNPAKERYTENGISNTKTYYENGTLKTNARYSKDGQIFKYSYFEDGHLEYYENAEEQLIKEFYHDHSLKKITEGDRRNPDAVKTFFENGAVSYEKYTENDIVITKRYNEERQLLWEDYKKDQETLSSKYYYPTGQLRTVYENNEEKITKEFYENGTLKKLKKGENLNSPDIDQEFYEDGTLQRENTKSEKGTTIYKSYHPNGQLKYYDNKDERVKKEFFENGNIKYENYFDGYSYAYKVYDEEQNIIKTNINSLKYAKTVSQNSNYDSEQKLANGLTIIKQNDKYGILNKKGKIVLPAKYDFIHFNVDNDFKMKDSVGEIRKGEKVGLVNSKGKIIVPLNYDRVDIYNSGTYYIVRKQNGDYKEGLIRKNGTATRPKYDEVDSYEEIDYAIVERNEKYGLLSTKKRKKLAPIIYDYVEVEEYYIKGDIEKEIVLVERNERYGLRNLKGKKITPVKFDEIEIYDGFDEGLAICTFSSANLFSKLPTNWFQLLEDWLDRSLHKEKPKRMGVVTLEGKTILPLKFGYIDLEEKNDFSYFRVSAFQKEYYRYNETEGIYGMDGKEIVPP